MSSSEETVRVLGHLGQVSQTPAENLLPAVYEELRHLASYYLKNERNDHTLQATALVHEALLSLTERNVTQWSDRSQFFKTAATVMRFILLNHARNRKCLKRGGGKRKLSLDAALAFHEKSGLDLLALDEALTKLAQLDARKSQIVELRFFGGLSVEETANVLSISSRTVHSDWSIAKLWLRREMASE